MTTKTRSPIPSRSPAPFVLYDKGELRERLTPLEYQVTQEKSTEKPHTNEFYKHREKGIYGCKICGIELFLSKTKYESGSGWPSFYDVIDKERIVTKQDASAVGGNLLLIVKKPEIIRTEVCCRNCGSHLGHVFKDGPQPTGLRYCINSVSMDFQPETVDQTDSGTGLPRLEEEIIACPATMGGCSSDGVCSLRSKKNVESRLKELKGDVPTNNVTNGGPTENGSAALP